MLNKPSLSPRTMLANCDGPLREKKGCLHHPHPSQGCDLRARRWSSVSNAQIFAPDKIIRTQPHPNVLHNQMIISFFFKVKNDHFDRTLALACEEQAKRMRSPLPRPRPLQKQNLQTRLVHMAHCIGSSPQRTPGNKDKLQRLNH
jgi:hypothetical protein